MLRSSFTKEGSVVREPESVSSMLTSQGSKIHHTPMKKTTSPKIVKMKITSVTAEEDLVPTALYTAEAQRLKWLNIKKLGVFDVNEGELKRRDVARREDIAVGPGMKGSIPCMSLALVPTLANLVTMSIEPFCEM